MEGRRKGLGREGDRENKRNTKMLDTVTHQLGHII